MKAFSYGMIVAARAKLFKKEKYSSLKETYGLENKFYTQSVKGLNFDCNKV